MSDAQILITRDTWSADSASELAHRKATAADGVMSRQCDRSAERTVPVSSIVAAAREAAKSGSTVPDHHGSFPTEAIDALREHSLLKAVLPAALGGCDLCEPERILDLRDVLVAIGRGSLVVGRLYEGHVNAIRLVLRYAAPEIRERLAADVLAGHLFGVWNTEPNPGGLVLDEAADGGYVLTGAKNFASGAGFVTRPLVTAQAGPIRLMLVVPLESGARSDLSAWKAHGMRASATGSLDFTGLRLGGEAIIGAADDYVRQPEFSCGAWRFLAVQCGGIAAVFEVYRAHLRKTGRGREPNQLARLGQAATALETAHLYVTRAARFAARAESNPQGAVAYVNLARGAVERAGLDVIELAQRSVGLAGFLEAHPLERLVRDLATYLRQPAPDLALASVAAYVLETEEPFHAVWPED